MGDAGAAHHAADADLEFLPPRRIALVFQPLDQRGEIGAGGEIDLRAFGGEVYARVEDAGGVFQRLFDMGYAGAAGHAVDFEGAGGGFFLQVHGLHIGAPAGERQCPAPMRNQQELSG